jgi:hypothetical protein
MLDRVGMKMSKHGRWFAVVFLCALPVANTFAAPDKEALGKTVDSGSFGVFMNGKRVATETFSIHQSSTGSSITSRFKTEAGPDQAEQSSELQLTPGGELKSYEWKEISPGQSQATVLPGQDFLTERYTSGPTDKPHEQPFLLPASTSVLDDYFFVQREVLAWKYLAISCRQEKNGPNCPLKEKAQLGTLNAHARASTLVNLQFSGREKISLHGVERELIRLDLKSESGDWTLWLDDQLKLQRMANEGNKTEVVRD